MTEKLYYLDSHQTRFTARVLSCVRARESWEVVTDRSCFFPEGGGQRGDSGTLGGAAVTDTQERGDEVVHLCAAPLPVGAEVAGVIDWETRFARMQLHSAEHIVSGLAHTLYGCENVGFHMSEGLVTLDLRPELTAPQVAELEGRANEAVWRNLPVRAWFPTGEELAALDYRSKKELHGAVRVVEFEGIDRCACCAPHVSRTGELGLIRLTGWMRHRGGVRLTMLSGRAAYANAAACGRRAAALSARLSAPQSELEEAVARLQGELEESRFALVALRRAEMERLGRAVAPTAGALCFFFAEAESNALRALVNACVGKCAVCAAFAGAESAWKYVLGSEQLDLREASRAMNAALHGRGGGSREMVQGSCAAAQADIERYFEEHYGKA